MSTQRLNCTACGACCASFRVDFSVHEGEAAGGPVPVGLCESVSAHTLRLRGTDHAQPRCAALVGTLGQDVHCAIYPWRPSPCRELAAGSAACARARLRHGLSSPPSA